MFLRRYTRTKYGKTHTYYALVESVCAPRPGCASTSSPTSASSTTTRNDAGSARSSFTIARGKTGNFASSPMPSPSPCPMIPISCGSASTRWAGPIPAASAMSGWACGSLVSSTSMRSLTATSPRERRRSGPRTSWPSRSSTASLRPLERIRPGGALVSVHRPGGPARRPRHAPRPRTACTGRWTGCSRPSGAIRTT